MGVDLHSCALCVTMRIVRDANMALFWSIWLLGIFVDSLLVCRGLVTRLTRRYPFFYAYSGSVLIGSVAIMLPGVYPHGYWQYQLLTLVLGYGILLEILNHVLAPYPGASRFARISGLLAFAIVLGFCAFYPVARAEWSAGIMIQFERNLRTIQAIFICGLLAIISYYRIAIGKNMKGMIAGYGLYVSTSLVSLALRSYAGMAFDEIWKVVQPLSYDVSLLVWMVALWSYSPEPVPEPAISLDADYEAFVARTKTVFGLLRAYLVKTARP